MDGSCTTCGLSLQTSEQLAERLLAIPAEVRRVSEALREQWLRRLLEQVAGELGGTCCYCVSSAQVRAERAELAAWQRSVGLVS